MTKKYDYGNEYFREANERKRDRAIAYLGGVCVRCGTKEKLEIDHVRPADKSFDLSSRNSLKDPVVVEELKKCQLLCEACHLAKTAQENSGFEHGTMYAWMKKRCPCVSCQQAKREWYDTRNNKRRTESKRGPYVKAADRQHGTTSMYWSGCRCEDCRKSRAVARKKNTSAGVG